MAENRAILDPRPSLESSLDLQSRFRAGDLRAIFEMAQVGAYREAVEMVKQASPKPTPCPKCGAPVGWFVRYGWRKACEWEQERRCSACEEATIRAVFHQQIDTTLADRGVPRRYRQASLEDFPRAVREVAQGIGSLCIVGPVGCGKSHLLAAKIRQAMLVAPMRRELQDDSRVPREAKFRQPFASDFPLFKSCNRLLLEIRQTFSQRGGDTEGGIIEECIKAPVLVLDDLGVERPSEWALSTLYEVIDRRYTEERPIWCSSNLGLEELAQRLGDRITSRIAGMCEVYEMAGTDRRLTEAKVTGLAPDPGLIRLNRRGGEASSGRILTTG